MTITGLGKITVTTAGTPVQVTATPTKVHQILFSFDPADTTSTIFVKDAAGNKIGALALGQPPLPFGGGSDAGDEIDISTLYVDANANSKGPIVGILIR